MVDADERARDAGNVTDGPSPGTTSGDAANAGSGMATAASDMLVPLFSYAEVGDILQLSPRVVRRLCLANELTLVYAGTTPGSSPRVTPASVRDFIDRRTRRAP